MRNNYWIEHKDIADLGYYFIEFEQEQKYLQSLNDELAMRVGTEAIKHLSPQKLDELSFVNKEDVFIYIMNNIPEMEKMVYKIRNDYLLEIKSKRRGVLAEDSIGLTGK